MEDTTPKRSMAVSIVGREICLWHPFVIGCAVLLLVISTEEGLCQQRDTVSSLVVEHQESHEQVSLAVGKTVMYKAASSRYFEKASITGITDSTISFDSKKLGNVAIRQHDLEAFKILRSSGRSTMGTILTILGAGGVVIGVVAISGSTGSSKDISGAIGIIFGIPGAAVLLGGIALLSNKHIDLKKSWRIVGKRAMTQTPLASSVKEIEPPGKFKIGLNIGYAFDPSVSPGPVFTLEPAYRANKNVDLGLRIEYAAMKGIDYYYSSGYQPPSAAITSLMANSQFYFNSGDFQVSPRKVKPFLGVGLGLYFSQGATRFGLCPRAGFDVGKFSLMAEYNSVASSSEIVATPAGGGMLYSTPVIIQNYFSFKIGYYIVTGKR